MKKKLVLPLLITISGMFNYGYAQASAECDIQTQAQQYLRVDFVKVAPPRPTSSQFSGWDVQITCKSNAIVKALPPSNSGMVSHFKQWENFMKSSGQGQFLIEYDVYYVNNQGTESLVNSSLSINVLTGASSGEHSLVPNSTYRIKRRSWAYIINNNEGVNAGDPGAPSVVGPGYVDLLGYGPAGLAGTPGYMYRQDVQFNAPYEPCYSREVYVSKVTPTTIDFGNVSNRRLKNYGDVGAKRPFTVELARKRMGSEGPTDPYYACTKDLDTSILFDIYPGTDYIPGDDNHLSVVDSSFKPIGLMVGLEKRSGQVLRFGEPIMLDNPIPGSKPGVPEMTRPSTSIDLNLVLKRGPGTLEEGPFEGTILYMFIIE